MNKLGQFGVISEEFTSGQQRPPPARPSLAPAPHYKLFSLTAPFVSGVEDLTAPWPAWGAWLLGRGPRPGCLPTMRPNARQCHTSYRSRHLSVSSLCCVQSMLSPSLGALSLNSPTRVSLRSHLVLRLTEPYGRGKGLVFSGTGRPAPTPSPLLHPNLPIP